jgi:Ca2+-binding EF-hand superfamily protein
MNEYYDYLDQSDSFKAFDLDRDGKLDRKEVGCVIACVLGIDANEKKVWVDGLTSFSRGKSVIEFLRVLMLIKMDSCLLGNTRVYSMNFVMF